MADEEKVETQKEQPESEQDKIRSDTKVNIEAEEVKKTTENVQAAAREGADSVAAARELSICNYFHQATFSGNLNQSGFSPMPGNMDSAMTSALADSEVAKIRAVFVETGAYAEARLRLQQERILILRGASGVGKSAAAVHMLAESECRQISLVKPRLTPAEIRSITFEGKTGYLGHGFAVEEDMGALHFFLHRLRNDLKAKDAYLILIVDVRDRGAAKLSEVVRDYDTSPDTARMVERHLDHYFHDPLARERANTLCREEAARKLLETPLSPQAVDRFALQLKQVIENDRSLEEALDAIPFDTEALPIEIERFHQFEEPERAFFVALATLDGCLLTQIQEAALQLFLFWNPAHEGPLPEPFGGSLTRLLRETGVHVERGGQTEYGLSDKEFLRLDVPAQCATILGYVRTERFSRRAALYQWLHWLGERPNSAIQRTSAFSAGLLCHTALGEVLDNLVRGWAKSPEPAARRMAAFALGAAAQDQKCAQQVLKLLSEWIKTENLRLCWTAAEAYGGWIGLGHPADAAQKLVALAAVGDMRLLTVICESLYRLFALGQHNPECRTAVLKALAACTDEEACQARGMRLILFLVVAEVEGRGDISLQDGKSWPAIAFIVRDNEALLEIVARLLRLSLNISLPREMACNTIGAWLARIDREAHADLYGTVVRILLRIAQEGDTFERETLLSYLENYPATASSPTAARKALNYILRELRSRALRIDAGPG